MSRAPTYKLADIDVELRNGEIRATLYGHISPDEDSTSYRYTTWNLDSATVLTEYKKRCAAAARRHPEMSPEQAEKAALLAWVKDMEAVAE